MEQELARPERFDLDLRRLRYFVAVADEMHFGRAAAQLYLAQPALSRQIRKLEEELGVELFVRTSRRVELTEAGRELLDAAKPLLAASLAAGRRARRAAKGGQRLTIGFFTGDPITSAVRGLAIRRPDVVVDVVRIYWHDQTDSLLDGRVDVALLHLPVTTAGLKLVPLYDAPRVALLPRNHPLADRQEVSITDLANDPVILHRGASPAWEAFHNTDPRPDGSHPRSGPVVSNIEEKLEQVAAGRAISFLPVSAAVAITLQPDVVVVPVTDIPPTHVCLAWSVEAESELIRAFVSLVPDTIDTDSLNETRSFLPALVRAPATPD